MTDPTTAPAVEGAAFDTSTAAGRLRILWGATADPQLAMSDDEVADVATVLDEHAAMAAELERLRTQMAVEPTPFRNEELAAAEEAFTAAWAESKNEPLRAYQPAHTFVSQWSVRYLEDGIVSEKRHTEAEARQRAKANPRTMALVTRLVEREWREAGGGDA